jgi:hypothetical protein
MVLRANSITVLPCTFVSYVGKGRRKGGEEEKGEKYQEICISGSSKW